MQFHRNGLHVSDVLSNIFTETGGSSSSFTVNVYGWKIDFLALLTRESWCIRYGYFVTYRESMELTSISKVYPAPLIVHIQMHLSPETYHDVSY